MNSKDRGPQRGWQLIGLTILSASFLWGRESASILYISQIFLHAIAGLFLSIIWTRAAVSELRTGTSSYRWFRSVIYISAVVSGLLILVLGVIGPFRWLLFLHIPTATVAGIWSVLSLLNTGTRKQSTYLVSICAVALLLFATSLIGLFQPYEPIGNEVLGPVTLSDNAMGGEQGPFFPSAVSTTSGNLIDESFFLESQTCGRSGCHVDAVTQWESSAHHFSSFNNQWYRKSIEYMQEVGGLERPKWCAGCHDPALLFAGNMAAPVDSFLASPASQAGVACVTCHTIKRVKNTGGNAAFELEYPPLHAIATHKNPLIQWVHDQLLKVDPAPHRASFMKPFLIEDQAAFCSSCHKVHLDQAVNDYRWVRGFNTYDNWQASGVSGQGARSFYQPETPKQCTDCHMKPTLSTDPGADQGTIRDHRFIAANTALPVANQDSVQLRSTLDFLEAGHLSVDVFGISKLSSSGVQNVLEVSRSPTVPNTSFAIGEEQLASYGSVPRTSPLNILGGLVDGEGVLEPGSTYRLDVVVRSLSVGHFFPTGTTDAQEAWLEVQIRDANGRVIVHSGSVDDGRVDQGSHFYKSLLVDQTGRVIDKRNAFAMRAPVYVNLIPPGGADVAHIVLEIPPDSAPPYHIVAQVNYRKFSQAYTEFAYGGEFKEALSRTGNELATETREWHYNAVHPGVSGKLKTLPEVPIAVMAKTEKRLGLGMQKTTDTSRSTVIRWNDYGIALMREGDIANAQTTFLKVVQLDPTYTDGWVNLARAYIFEGAWDKAKSALQRAEQLQPGFYKTMFFNGIVFKSNGQFNQAIQSFQEVLRTHPRDRVVLNELGRSFYLNEQLQEAIEPLESVLRIDAEDVSAHYNLMLVYQALGNAEKSAAHKTRYEHFKADETQGAIARKYRESHPIESNEALPIHLHW
ncbi:tetratricopeptide repeat protein [bacterium]|nr:tetratricopeptide repeat protein [bacterium]